MQKFKSKLLPLSSFSRLPSVIWKRKETSKCNSFLKLTRTEQRVIRRIFPTNKSASRGTVLKNWKSFVQVDILLCKMCNRRALVSAFFFFFSLKFYQSRHRIYSPSCIIVMVNHEGINLFFFCKYVQKNYLPLAIEGNRFSGGEWATLFLRSVHFHKFLRLESCYFLIGL